MLPKKIFRQQLRSAMAGLSAGDIESSSQCIHETVTALPQLQQARSAFVYVSRPPEVRTEGLLQYLLQRGCELAVPLIVAGEDGGSCMHAVHISSLQQLQPGRFGIMAPPASSRRYSGQPDIAIVPGLGFDKSGGRLGQGKGYYDRWLEANPDCCRIALAHDMQIVQALPVAEHDISMHIVVTGTGVMRF